MQSYPGYKLNTSPSLIRFIAKLSSGYRVFRLYDSAICIKTIFYTSSTRSLLIYLSSNPNAVSHTLFFIEESVPAPIREGLHHITLPTPLYRDQASLCISILCVRVFLRLCLGHLSSNINFAGTDNQIYSPIFYKKNNYCAYEEGAGEYLTSCPSQHTVAHPEWLKNLKQLLIYGCIRNMYGTSPFVKTRVLTRSPSQLSVKQKCIDHILSLTSAIRSLPKDSDSYIIINNWLYRDALTLMHEDQKCAIIILQPFSQFGILSQDYEQEIYSHMVKEILSINSAMKIYFKLHPMQDVAPDFVYDFPYISGNLPTEALLLIPEKIGVIATVNSASLQDFSVFDHIQLLSFPL